MEPSGDHTPGPPRGITSPETEFPMNAVYGPWLSCGHKNLLVVVRGYRSSSCPILGREFSLKAPDSQPFAGHALRQFQFQRELKVLAETAEDKAVEACHGEFYSRPDRAALVNLCHLGHTCSVKYISGPSSGHFRIV